MKDISEGGYGVSHSICNSPAKYSKSVNASATTMTSSMAILVDEKEDSSYAREITSKYGYGYDDIPPDSASQSELGSLNSLLEATVFMTQFSDQALPKSYIQDEKYLKIQRGKYRLNFELILETVYTIIRSHYLSAMIWGGSSLKNPRTLRFLVPVRKMLLLLFTDTLIFGLYFPADSTCTHYHTEKSCQALPSKVQKIKTYNCYNCTCMYFSGNVFVNLFIYLFIYLFIHSFIYSFTYLYIYLFIHLSIHNFTNLLIYLLVNFLTFLFLYLLFYLFIY